MKVGWQFWLFGVAFVVGLEALRVLVLLSQGYVWVPIEEDVSASYWAGALLGYALLVVIVAYASAWIWSKTHKRK